MVTMRQFARGATRTMRAIDREAKRAESRRIAYEKAAQKLEMREAAADAADQYDDMLRQLTSGHQMAFQPVDWRGRAAEELRPEPVLEQRREAAAQRALSACRPGWLARAIGWAEYKRKVLSKAVEDGRAADALDHATLLQSVRDHNAGVKFARRLLDLDKDAVVEALNDRSALGDLPFNVEGLDVIFSDDGSISARVNGLDLEDMPTQSVSLLQSGKASIKPLSRGRVLELHRANICSSALRMAIEFLSVIPIDAVRVEMLTDILDPATGHITARPVLRLRVARQAIETLALTRAEAAAVAERLGAEMSWSKRDGFKPLPAD